MPIPVDGRAVSYSLAFFSARHLGEGQFYLMTIVDKDGHPLDGGGRYRLTVPPDAPVSRYWSATVYDRATHALIRNQARSSRSSLSPGLRRVLTVGGRVLRSQATGGQRGQLDSHQL